MGLTSDALVTMPRTVTSFPMESALTSLMTFSLVEEGGWKYSSLRESETEGVCVNGTWIVTLIVYKKLISITVWNIGYYSNSTT